MMIVALDVATRTGVCVGRRNEQPRAWSVDLGAGKAEAARFSAALALTHALIEKHKPDLIAVEAAVGGPKTSHFLVGILACVRGCAFNRGVAVETFDISSIRKHFLGKHISSVQFKHLPEKARKAVARKEAKSAVMHRCRSLGYAVGDDDAADAAALWDYAMAVRAGRQAAPVGGLFA